MRVVLMAAAALLVVTAAYAAEAGPVDDAEAENQRLLGEMRAEAVKTVSAPLALFEKEKKGACASKNLSDAQELAERLYALHARAARGRKLQDAIEVATVPVDAMIKVGDVAARRGCRDQARDAYMKIVDYYTGGAYGGVRDRAKARLDLLK